MSLTILVTGGAGFIGSHLCRHLIKEGNSVICIDNLFSGNKENINDLIDSKQFTFIEHDIVQPIYLEAEIDQIYHLACPASPKAYQLDPLFTLQTCFTGTFNICNLSVLKNAKILFTSTSEIYGDPLIHPQVESYFGNVNTIGIRSCYDEGKRIGETIFTEFHRNKSLRIQIARIFNTYGPNMSPNDGRVVTNFVSQYIQNKDITIYGDGLQTRSLCYVTDTLNGLIALMAQDSYIGPTNIGNPHEQTIREIAETIGGYFPKSTSIITYENLPQDDPTCRKPDIKKAQKKLKWCPKVLLHDGITATIHYLQDKI
jgi:UDP-glucuronate decarboxylase